MIFAGTVVLAPEGDVEHVHGVVDVGAAGPRRHFVRRH